MATKKGKGRILIVAILAAVAWFAYWKFFRKVDKNGGVLTVNADQSVYYNGVLVPNTSLTPGSVQLVNGYWQGTIPIASKPVVQWDPVSMTFKPV